MDNALARLLGQEPLESLDGPGKEHMIDAILNVLSHAEDEGSGSSQENTPQHVPTPQHAPTPPLPHHTVPQQTPVIKQTLPSLSTILATTGTGKKESGSSPGLNTTAAATLTSSLQYQHPTTVVTTRGMGSLSFKQESSPLVLPPYQTVTVRTTSSDIEDGDPEGDDGESPLTSEDEEDSPSPGNTPVKLPSFPTLTSSAALRYSDAAHSNFLTMAQLAGRDTLPLTTRETLPVSMARDTLTRDNLAATLARESAISATHAPRETTLPAAYELLRSGGGTLPSAHSLQQFLSHQRAVASFPDAREVLAAKAEPLLPGAAGHHGYESVVTAAAFLESTPPLEVISSNASAKYATPTATATPSIRDYIVTTATETKPPKYSTFDSSTTRAAVETVANTPSKSALHATLQGEYQPATTDSSAEEDAYRSYTRAAEPELNVKTLPTRPAAPLDYLAAAAARYEYQHYPKGIAVAKSSHSVSDYKVALTTSPSSYRHVLPQTVQTSGLTSGLMSSAAFAYKAQLQGAESDLAEIMTGRHVTSTSTSGGTGSTKDKFAGIPHDELALKTEVYGDRAGSFQKEYSLASEHVHTTLPSGDEYLMTSSTREPPPAPETVTPTTSHVALASTSQSRSQQQQQQQQQQQAALTAATQAALVKMQAEFLKKTTAGVTPTPQELASLMKGLGGLPLQTLLLQAAASGNANARQFVAGTAASSPPVSDVIMTSQTTPPPVTTTASHLPPKKRGRPPKGPGEDFSPPEPFSGGAPSSGMDIPVSGLHQTHQTSTVSTPSGVERFTPGFRSSLPTPPTPPASGPPSSSPAATPPPAPRGNNAALAGEQICMNCGQYFSSSLMFDKHVTSRTCERYKGPYSCPKCSKQFTRRFNLQLHLQKGCAKKKRNSYWPANKEEYEEYAREQSAQKVQLNQGKRKSGIWHKCGKCGQAFTEAQVYNSHIAICLAGKKLFKCKYCPKQFSRRSGNLQIHMLTCPGKAQFEESGGGEESGGHGEDPREYRPSPQPPALAPAAPSGPQDPYLPEDWSIPPPPPPMPRKKPRRTKVPKSSDETLPPPPGFHTRSPLDVNITGHDFYSNMRQQLEAAGISASGGAGLPPSHHHPPPPQYQPPPPPPPPLRDPQEQKILLQHQMIKSVQLQQEILQRERELIKQEHFSQELPVQQMEGDAPSQEDMQSDMRFSHETQVPPPLAVVKSAIVAPPSNEIPGERTMSDVAANIAVSTEQSITPLVLDIPTPKKRVKKSKTAEPRVETVVLPPPPPPPAPEPEPVTTEEEEGPFIPVMPEPLEEEEVPPSLPPPPPSYSPPKIKIKTETKGSRVSGSKKRSRSSAFPTSEAAIVTPPVATPPVTVQKTTAKSGRSQTTRKDRKKPKKERESFLMSPPLEPIPPPPPLTPAPPRLPTPPPPPPQIPPPEIPGCKINYATTSITTENVLTHKRIKKRPNYALMNEDAENERSRARKAADVTTRSQGDAALTSQKPRAPPEVSGTGKTPVVPPSPAVASARSKRRKVQDVPQPEPEVQGEEEDDDDFTPKHVRRSKAAKLKQEVAEPDFIAIDGGSSYKCKCGKVCRRQADITRHLEFCKCASKITKPYACACGAKYVNAVSVHRHQKLTKCAGYRLGPQGTVHLADNEAPPVPGAEGEDGAQVKGSKVSGDAEEGTPGAAARTRAAGGARQSGRKRAQVEPEPLSQDDSDTGLDSSVTTAGTGSGSEKDAASSLDSPVKMAAEHKKHYRCANCHRKFVNRKTYQRHRTIYCSAQTHECPTCKETFSSATVLAFHQMEHQEQLPFGCSICGSKFRSSSTLNRHRETHAPVKKPIKKLKIKIIDGSCVISKVDSPAQRDAGSRENSPTNQNGEGDPGGQSQTRDSAESGVMGGTEEEKPTNEYMVSISTVEEGNDDTEDAENSNHVILPETVVMSNENAVMISNQDGVMTFSEVGASSTGHQLPPPPPPPLTAAPQCQIHTSQSALSSPWELQTPSEAVAMMEDSQLGDVIKMEPTTMAQQILANQNAENDLEESLHSYTEHQGLKLPVLLPSDHHTPSSLHNSDFSLAEESPLNTQQKVIVAPIQENSTTSTRFSVAHMGDLSHVTQIRDLSHVDEIRSLKDGEIFAESDNTKDNEDEQGYVSMAEEVPPEMKLDPDAAIMEVEKTNDGLTGKTNGMDQTEGEGNQPVSQAV